VAAQFFSAGPPHAPLFKVADFVGHEASFAGVEIDGELVTTDDLLS
jgi:hypothetical protein